LSRIAIIDTAIDPGRIGGKSIEYIDLTTEPDDADGGEASHGDMCAMILNHCAGTEYELINIRILDHAGGHGSKAFGEIENLAKALALCIELKADVVSLSAVSSILSDSKRLYGVTLELAERAVIVSSLDNSRYMTLPTGYPHVVGVRADRSGLLQPGGIAYKADDPFGANIYANCDFAFLRELGRRPSNSFAVPVAAAYASDLLYKGRTAKQVRSDMGELPPYPDDEGDGSQVQPPAPEGGIPVVFIADRSADACLLLMDALFDRHGVQSSALSLAEGAYDVRVRRIGGPAGLMEGLRFMERHYKTDLIFITGAVSLPEGVRRNAEIDVDIHKQRDGTTALEYEGEREEVPDEQAADRLHDILAG